MTANQFYKLLIKKFPFKPTVKQNIVLTQLSHFVFDDTPDQLYLLKGFAGTGKTTLISTFVTHLWHVKKKAVLMAPTGRAAKVISNYSNKEAFTIHKKIYFPKKEKNGGVKFVLQPNKHRDTIFIIDEASMISDMKSTSKLFDNESLLNDLIQYVYSGYNCKLIFIGDTAQLPPVKLDLSPALNENTLNLDFNKDVVSIELDEVVRQQEKSGILHNATAIRKAITNDDKQFTFNLKGFKDIVRLKDGYEIMDAINTAYSELGYEDSSIIVRSNKRANLYN